MLRSVRFLRQKRRDLLLVVAVSCLFAGLFFVFQNGRGEAFAQPEIQRPAFAKGKVVITRQDGTTFPYGVEIAQTLDEQAYGLMFRKTMPEGEGMIFIFDPVREVSFWMKNTFLPLDMVFADAAGKIVRIVESAGPQDETPIPSGVPVRYVLELNAGQTKAQSIRLGDRLSF